MAATPTDVETLLAQFAALAKLNDMLFSDRTFAACCLSVLGYDMVASIPQEYSRIYKRKISILSTLHVLNRIFTFLAFIDLNLQWFLPVPPHICRVIHFIQPIGLVVVYAICEAILAMRVWALYARNTAIAIAIGINLCIGIILQMISTVRNRALVLPPGVNGCYTSSKHKTLLMLFFIWPLWHSVLIFGLTLFKTLNTWRASGRTPLLKILVRDGAFYFFIVGAVNLMNVFYWTLPNITNQVLLAPLAVCVTSMCCARLVLNLREPNSPGSSSAAVNSNDIRGFHTSGSNPKTFGSQHISVPLAPFSSQPSYIDSEKGMVEKESLSASEDDGVPTYQGLYMERERVSKASKTGQ